jgi:CBS domain-containing protein
MTLATGALDRLGTPSVLASPLVRVLDLVGEAEDSTTVAAAGRMFPAAVAELATADPDAVEIGRDVSGVIDAITRRLIDLSVAELGEPPAQWAWIALGSAARREQGIVTDQDHALAFDPGERPLAEVDEYFRLLAESVTSGLEAVGIPRCRADVVATNQALRRPLDHWIEAFERWMADTRMESVRQTAILFDHRRVAGPLEVEHTLGKTIASSPDRPAYIERLARFTTSARSRTHIRLAQRIDLKHEGLIQIIGMARALAVSGGIREAGTIERLRLADEHGLLSKGSALGLIEAFRFIWRMRLDSQIEACGAGNELSERIRLRGPLRRQLAVPFDAIRAARDEVLQRLPSSTGLALEAPRPSSPVR